MNAIGKQSTPWHLWVVGVLALLWHAGGANDYIQVQTGNADYIGDMARAYGMEAQAVMDYYAGWSWIGHSAWAIGIWGGVLGCVLLLLRLRFAFHAFAASLLGTLATLIYRLANPLEGVETGTAQIVFTIAIFAVTVALMHYSRVQAARSVLR